MSEPIVKNLVNHIDDRGFVREVLRCDDPFFKQFGQAYVSAVNSGVIKGFHKHFRQTEHITCIYGQVKLVLVDFRDGNKNIYEYNLSPLAPKLVVVEPDVWYGWRGLGLETSLLMNITTEPYDSKNPDGVKMDPHDPFFDYDWKVKDR